MGYELLLAQLTATALYLFVDDVLTRAKYLITQEHSHDGAFLMDFRTLGDFLGQKYGPPTSVEEFWNNDLYQDSPNEWGMAVSAGHLSRYEIWNLPETDIYLVLAGDNYQVRLEIEYTAKALVEFETAVKTAAILDDL
ncbi:hypothetical protein B7R21_04780 [Subtercola boreus]|uniref:Uncharacterized protein n=1 Tax=Subtercola boreus TaxID=120213 RepID=A0A3E0W1E3_9MICO|nr:hypothetical protein B7R21_04780 [Subtercola boreus]